MNLPVPIIVSIVLILIGLLGVALGFAAKSSFLDVQTDKPISKRRKIFLGVGIALLVGGLGWLITEGIEASNSSSDVAVPTSQAGLISVSFTVDGWNPHLVDLRTAEGVGIPVSPGNALKFFDLYVYEPNGSASTKLQMEFYAPGEEFIGSSERLPLVSGTNRFEKVEVQSYQDSNIVNAWKVQPEWNVISVVLIHYDAKDVKTNASTVNIRLNPESHTWLTTSPDVSFASIAYTMNDGTETWLDFHQVLSSGLNLRPDDKLKITQIWYRADDPADGILLGVEAYLTNKQFNRDTYINNPNNPLDKGLHLLSNFSNPFEWVVKEEDNMLIMTLARSDGFVVDRLEIPVLSSATQ
jgi:hypothetical protein